MLRSGKYKKLNLAVHGKICDFLQTHALYSYCGYDQCPKPRAYDPEQTYFSNYFDLGLWGFLAFLLLHFYIMKQSYKKRQNLDFLRAFSGAEGVMIAFMGYHYTIYSVSMLIIIAGACIAFKNSDYEGNS